MAEQSRGLSRLTVSPVHQDDADGKEGDDGGEEIGCRYTVNSEERPVQAARSSKRSDGGVGVVAVKHQAMGQEALPKPTARGVRERGRMSGITFRSSRSALPSP